MERRAIEDAEQAEFSRGIIGRQAAAGFPVAPADCPHPGTRQELDGAGTVCLDCGACRVRVRV
jgi:ferredoxin-like protein FixX